MAVWVIVRSFVPNVLEKRRRRYLSVPSVILRV
jgi:hypothetical protein